MGQVITSGDLVKKFGGELIGDSNILIDSAASLESSNQNSVSFFNNSKYQDLLKITKAAIVITNSEGLAFRKGPAIITNNPYLYFAKVSRLLNPSKALKKRFISLQSFILLVNSDRISLLAPTFLSKKMFLLLMALWSMQEL